MESSIVHPSTIATAPAWVEELDALVERRKAREAERAAEEAARAKEPPPAPAVPVQERQTITCGMCEQPFDSVVFFVAGLPAIRKLYCDPCVFAHEAAQRAPDGRSALFERWAALCAPEFRTKDEGGSTVFARLERDCAKLGCITGWKFGEKGLLIRGETGRCKTRAVWRLLRAQFDGGRRIAATTAGRFARDFADAAGNNRQVEWFNPLVEADIFFLDDLGKKPWTPNVWAEFFELIDERAKHHRPFILTTNDDRETLERKCADPVTWAPLLRRLTENTASIVL